VLSVFSGLAPRLELAAQRLDLASKRCGFGVHLRGKDYKPTLLPVTQCCRGHTMQRHYQGVPRHSMSRGEHRIKEINHYSLVQIGLFAFLLLFAPVLAALFFSSRVASKSLRAQQEAAILARYFDAIDAKIEAEYLQSALEGNTAPEITYLYGPLPGDMPAEMRKNIAAAAAGHKVEILAQRPGGNGGNRAAQPTRAEGDSPGF
jgi:hypothetical protein